MSNTKNIPRLIIDTDFETDCDDAGALAVAHKLADENIIELAAVNASVNSPLPALGAAALNAAFGRRNIQQHYINIFAGKNIHRMCRCAGNLYLKVF
jgi:hypothetical protein